MMSAENTFDCNGCPVHVGMAATDALRRLPPRTVVVTDENVERLHGHLTEGMPRIVLPAGEETKSLATIEQVCRQLVALGADRGSFLLAVGGGVVCDITGMVASVFMRGVGFALMPSTLLAQVDAAIGGKTGVNSGPYKNLIGTFARPAMVVCDPQLISTLPDTELSNGLAECIKHACIADGGHFLFLEKNIDLVLNRDAEALRHLTASSVRIKTDIVNHDPVEKGLRKLLNFGHTYGHAIERHHGIAHGQAVSLGMCIANEMAVRQGHLRKDESNRITRLLGLAGLPTDTAGLNMDVLRQLLIGDKKRSGDMVSFVLLRRIGEAFIQPMPIP